MKEQTGIPTEALLIFSQMLYPLSCLAQVFDPVWPSKNQRGPQCSSAQQQFITVTKLLNKLCDFLAIDGHNYMFWINWKILKSSLMLYWIDSLKPIKMNRYFPIEFSFWTTLKIFGTNCALFPNQRIMKSTYTWKPR